MAACWYIVRSVHGADYALRESLRRIGYQVYYPQRRVMRPIPRNQLSLKQRRHHAPIIRPFLEPLFPTYLFVNFDMGDPRWHEIFSIVGIVGLFSAGNYIPIECSNALIDGLLAHEVDGALPGLLCVTEVAFKTGQRVRLLDGPFQGLGATIGSLDEDGSYRLLMDLLGRQSMISGVSAASLKTA